MDDKQVNLEKRRRLYKWQWYITYLTLGCSAVAIGLSYAKVTLLAQLAMVLVLACFIASVVVAYQRYQLNKIRRDEIIAEANAERDRQLVELFDDARKEKGLPADGQSRDGYSAAVEEAKARAAAQEAARQANLPPGVKRRGK
jgi:hypothetical protein